MAGVICLVWYEIVLILRSYGHHSPVAILRDGRKGGLLRMRSVFVAS